MTWYRHGLSFSCTLCGECCGGEPGFVWISETEADAIATHLGLSREEFLKRHTRLVGGRISLLERPGGDCTFLTDDRRCSIQPVKPRQCVTYPFWPRLVASKTVWDQEGVRCPGIGNGPRYDEADIEALVDPTTPREVACRILKQPV